VLCRCCTLTISIASARLPKTTTSPLILVVFWKNIPEYGQISPVPENLDVDYQLVMSLARRWYYTYQQRT
jgi:hypothetical protein